MAKKKLTYEELARLGKLREQYMLKREALLKETVDGLQRTVLEAVFDQLLANMETDAGNLLNSKSNIRLINAMDAIYDRFRNSSLKATVKTFADDLDGLFNLNRDYFRPFTGNRELFARVSDSVQSIMRANLGIGADDRFINNGYLDSFVKDNRILVDIKQQLYNAVGAGNGLADTQKFFRQYIAGEPGKYNGILHKHFDGFIYDTYAEYDRTTSDEFAVELGLECFVYAGGLIDTSRCFCREHNGKVYTRKEAEKWRLQVGKPCGPIVSRFMVYNPLRNLGGIRCRHVPNYVTNDIAIQRRPDLEGVLKEAA